MFPEKQVIEQYHLVPILPKPWLRKPWDKLKISQFPIHILSFNHYETGQSLITLHFLPNLWAEASLPTPQPILMAPCPDLMHPFSSPANLFPGPSTLKRFSKPSPDPPVYTKHHLSKQPIYFNSKDSMIISTGSCRAKRSGHHSRGLWLSHWDQTIPSSIMVAVLLVWSPDQQQEHHLGTGMKCKLSGPTPHPQHQKLQRAYLSFTKASR